MGEFILILTLSFMHRPPAIESIAGFKTAASCNTAGLVWVNHIKTKRDAYYSPTALCVRK